MDKETPPPSNFLEKVFKNTDLAFTFCLFGIVILLIMPVKPMFMDVLLAGSIGCSLLILLIVVYVKEPAEFSVFPTILLAVTLYRLGLNVASTRLILLDGYAGGVIDSFGNFVVRSNYVVGAVVFLILIVINFVVITKGAGRIAEVAARFTLDAMPGKQMSIDAELNAGLIDEASATKRRLKIQKEADFYGAMDGASKFVRGDAIAGILITIINVVGGIAIGVFQKNLPLMDSLQKYTLLSIGDGLVSQVPALIISVGAGILITRTGEGINLGEHLGRQIFIHPRALAIAASMLFIFGLMPSMPFAPFAALGILIGGVAYLVKKHESELSMESSQGLEGPTQKQDEEILKPGSNKDLQKIIHVDTFSIELGYGLLGLADSQASGDLLERITGVRQKIARELGIVLPPIAVRDNLDLETNKYRFLMRNKVLASSELFPSQCLAMNISGSTTTLTGTPTIEPVFGLEAVWIAEDERQTAEMNGFTVVDAPSVLITHLSEILKDNSHYLLEREDVQKLIDNIKENNATLINELLPDLVSVGLVQRVLQNLLKEHISIKNLTLILETIADFATLTKNPDELSEQVRKVLGVYFAEDYESQPGLIKALTLDPRLEQHLISRIQRSQFEVGLMMDPALTESLIHEFSARLKHINEQGLDPILMTTADLRLPFKRFFDPSFPRLNVLAYQELPNQTQVQSLGIIPLPENITQAASAGMTPAIN